MTDEEQFEAFLQKLESAPEEKKRDLAQASFSAMVAQMSHEQLVEFRRRLVEIRNNETAIDLIDGNLALRELRPN